MILNRISDYFDMDIKATRLNWYKLLKTRQKSSLLPPGTEIPVSGSRFIMMLQQ